MLGTVGYMSPEQVRGAAVDQRSDIFALGAVLYEMLSGRRAVPRDTAAETMTAILKEDPPDLTASGVQAPPALARIVKRCLEKHPGERFHSAHDLGIALETVSSDSGRSPSISATSPAPGRERLAWIVAAALFLAALTTSALLWRANTRTAGDAVSPIRMTLRFPEGRPMHLGAPQPSLAISPDGQRIVYTANAPKTGAQLWVHALDQFESAPLPGTGGSPGGPRNAFFSPDGRFIGFFADGKLKRIPAAGGVATVICDAPQQYGGTWTSRDEIIFAAGATELALWRVAASGGDPQMIVKGIFSYPDALPGGTAVVASGENPQAATSSELGIARVDVTTGDVKRLVHNGAYPRYAATGHLLFLRDGSLVAAAFDSNSGALGDPVPVTSGVFQNQANASGNYAVSAAGVLAYAPGTGNEFRRSLITIDMKGAVEPLGGEQRFFDAPRSSPDGQRIAVTVPAWRDGVWIVDRTRGVITELTTGDANGVGPVWTPDGTRVVFAAYGPTSPRNLYWMAADGSGTPERLATSVDQQRPNAFTPDGRILVYELRTNAGTDLWTLTFDEKRTTRPLLETRFRESQAAISPDGKWMTYSSDQSGRGEVYLTSFPALERRVQVSVDGGSHPVWSRDGKRLFYRLRLGAEIMAVDVALGASITLSKPISLAKVSPAPPAGGSFDVMPDGRLLLVDNEQEAGDTRELRVVLNWFGELKQKVPAK